VVHADNRTLAESLQSEGFHTAAFLGSFALSSRFGFDQGFDHFDEDFDREMDLRSGLDQNQRRAQVVTDAVLGHLDELDRDERLFLFVHYFDAHTPYDPPPPYDRRFATSGQRPRWSLELHSGAVRGHQERILGESLGLAGVIEEGMPRALVDAHGIEPTQADLHLASLYAGEVAYVDGEIGRLLAGLKERGVLEDALVVLTGDHGETFWEHGVFWSHGDWVFDTNVRVPLILRFPDQRSAGLRVFHPVSTVDLLPTLFDYLGLPCSELVEGESLKTALEGGVLARAPVFSGATKPGPRFEPRGLWGNLAKARCVRDGPWKYVHAPYREEAEQLFRLDRDPLEQDDLLLRPERDLEHEAQRVRLRALLDGWVREKPVLPSFFDKKFRDDTNRRLIEMGYLGEDAED
jgi:arylsulfatase A-like enzyme